MKKNKISKRNSHNEFLQTENQYQDQSGIVSKKENPCIKIAYEPYYKYIERKFEKSFLEVRDIINEFDPLQLIEIGAPSDEYESEVGVILLDILNAKDKDDILNIITKEFGYVFGSQKKDEKKDCKDLAKSIYDWKKSNGL